MEVEEWCYYGEKDKEAVHWFLHSFFSSSVKTKMLKLREIISTKQIMNSCL